MCAVGLQRAFAELVSESKHETESGCMGVYLQLFVVCVVRVCVRVCMLCVRVCVCACVCMHIRVCVRVRLCFQPVCLEPARRHLGKCGWCMGTAETKCVNWLVKKRRSPERERERLF